MSETRDPTTILREALNAANARATAAARERDEARGQLRGETVNRVAAQEQAADNAIVAAENERNSLSERWAGLQAEGNFAEAGKVMGQMAEAAARLDRFKAQKEWLSGQRQQVSAAPSASADPLARFNPAERNWIAQNPEYLSDPMLEARVNQAHNKALGEGKIKDSPEYFDALTRAAHPERYTAPSTNTQQPQADATGGRTSASSPDGASDGATESGQDIDDSPLSGADIEIDTSPPQQRHTRDADPAPINLDAPVMRIDTATDGGGNSTQQPQPRQRAVGRGGEGLRAVSAPPSRRIVQASNQAARGGQIEPTMEELLTARQLYDSIEPNAEDRSDVAAVRWYHFYAHHPSHQNTRRRSWARESIIG
jgi:hypothetical protein